MNTAKNSILERGRFIRTCANPENLAYFRENRELLTDLFRQFRMEWICGKDDKPLNVADKEWIAIGSKGQVWEYGPRKLGITVIGEKWAPSFIRQTEDFCTITQGGDGEANLKCDWTTENVAVLAKFLKLHRSRKIRSEAQKAVLMRNLKVLNLQSETVAGSKNRSMGFGTPHDGL